ncbi:hypothetical protein ACTMU2_29085 [Cupriavidus basilensis]
MLRWASLPAPSSASSRQAKGTFSVADPRHAGPAKHSNEFRIVPWQQAAGAVTECPRHRPMRAGSARVDGLRGAPAEHRITGYDEPARHGHRAQRYRAGGLRGGRPAPGHAAASAAITI